MRRLLAECPLGCRGRPVSRRGTPTRFCRPSKTKSEGALEHLLPFPSHYAHAPQELWLDQTKPDWGSTVPVYRTYVSIGLLICKDCFSGCNFSCSSSKQKVRWIASPPIPPLRYALATQSVYMGGVCIGRASGMSSLRKIALPYPVASVGCSIARLE